MPGCWLPDKAVEHYEIARYGTPKDWAAQLGLKEASALSDQKAIKEDGCAAQQVGASVGKSLSRPIIRSSRGIERISSTRRFATSGPIPDRIRVWLDAKRLPKSSARAERCADQKEITSTSWRLPTLKSLSDEFCAGRLRLPGGGNLKLCQFSLKNENVPPNMNQCAPRRLESLHQEEFVNERVFDFGFILFRPPLVSHFQLVRGRAAASSVRLSARWLATSWDMVELERPLVRLWHASAEDLRSRKWYGGLSGYEQLGGNGEHRGDREY